MSKPLTSILDVMVFIGICTVTLTFDLEGAMTLTIDLDILLSHQYRRHMLQGFILSREL